MEAEPFIYGVHAPNGLVATALAPYSPNTYQVPAAVNRPIFIEPNPRLAASSSVAMTSAGQQLWIVVSDSDPTYAGAVVFMSTDGGNSYNSMGNVIDSAVTGVTTADWPAAADQDTTNDLPLDLTESLGTLASYQVADEDAFTYPCWVNGGSSPPAAPTLSQVVSGALAATTYFVKVTYTNALGESLPSDESSLAVLINNVLVVTSPSAATGMTGYNVYASTATGTETKQAGPINLGTNWQEPNTGLVAGAALPLIDSSATIPYELMTYAVATLTATNKYTLKATGGNHLRRAVFGCPVAMQGVLHPNGARWAFLNPGGSGIFKMNMDPKWVGKTLFFKFQAFNQFYAGAQDPASLTVYSYTPAGVAQGSNPNNFNYTITGGALTQPAPTTIHMAQATANFPSNTANYNARDFTIAAPTNPTTYYVTIYDPSSLGDTGTMTNLTAQCQTSNALVGAAGYVYIGSIVAISGGGGTTTGGGGQPAAPINPYDVVFSLPGAPGLATFLIVNFSRTVKFQANFAGSTGRVLTNPTATATFTLLKNGVSTGTVVVSTGGVVTFTSTGGNPVTFNSGDYLEITTPSPVDATLNDFEMTLSGTR